MNQQIMRDCVEAYWHDCFLPALIEYIAIPCKSPAFDPSWASNRYLQNAIELISQKLDYLRIDGLTKRVFQLPGRTPVLIAEVPAYKCNTGNVFLYGHYDKQPEFEGWRDGFGPWKPVIQNERLYGRGGADDGYAAFASLGAIAALREQNLAHPRCFILIEGCEESGSYDLPFYIKELEEEIGLPDLAVCLDAECGNYDQLWLTTSLRGLLSGFLTVEVLTEGVHSGGAGGIVPSSFRLIRCLLERLERADTGRIAALETDIPDTAAQQATSVAHALGRSIVEKFPWSGRTGPSDTDSADLLLSNTWRPSLEVVGLSGVPDAHSAGNTLRPKTEAKLVARIPPTLDAKSAANNVRLMLESDPPQNATVRFELEAAETGWHAPNLTNWLRDSLERASQSWFGKPCLHIGSGGTIPFMNMLRTSFPHCQFMVTGVLGPQSNAHGPNEFLDLPTAKKITCCVASVLHDISKLTS